MGKLFPRVFLHYADSYRSHDTFSSTRVNPDHFQAVISVAGLDCPEQPGLPAQK